MSEPVIVGTLSPQEQAVWDAGQRETTLDGVTVFWFENTRNAAGLADHGIECARCTDEGVVHFYLSADPPSALRLYQQRHAEDSA